MGVLEVVDERPREYLGFDLVELELELGDDAEVAASAAEAASES